MKGNKFPLVLMPDISARPEALVRISQSVREKIEKNIDEYSFEVKNNSFELTQVKEVILTETDFIEIIFWDLSDMDIDPASWSFQHIQDEDATHYILTIHLIQP